MDVLLLLIGLTLATAGWLLVRDYTRFIYSAYHAKGRVVSIEPAFRPGRLAYSGEQRAAAYFPVIEYLWNGERLRFTAIMDEAAGCLAMGDAIDLQVSRSRRCQGRMGRGMLLLMLLLAALTIVMLGGADWIHQKLSILQICLVSLVLTVSLSIIVMYFRQQDESMMHRIGLWRRASWACISLQEPTAARHWPTLLTSRRQKARILYSRLFGGSCMAVGLLFVVAAFHSLGWNGSNDLTLSSKWSAPTVWVSTPKS